MNQELCIQLSRHVEQFGEGSWFSLVIMIAVAGSSILRCEWKASTHHFSPHGSPACLGYGGRPDRGKYSAHPFKSHRLWFDFHLAKWEEVLASPRALAGLFHKQNTFSSRFANSAERYLPLTMTSNAAAASDWSHGQKCWHTARAHQLCHDLLRHLHNGPCMPTSSGSALTFKLSDGTLLKAWSMCMRQPTSLITVKKIKFSSLLQCVQFPLPFGRVYGSGILSCTGEAWSHLHYDKC